MSTSFTSIALSLQNTESPRLHIRELENIVNDAESQTLINDAFPEGRHATNAIRHFEFVSHSIRKMKKELQRYQIEQERIFIQLEDDRLFTEDFHHIMQYYRLRKAQSNRSHPYRRPSSTTRPRSRYSDTSDRSVVILPSDADALISQPPSSSSSNSTSYHSIGEGPSGTRENPIVILDENDEKVCERCSLQGHHKDDCNTPIRSFSHCETCAWTGQQECDHYDVSPAWLRQQQKAIDDRRKSRLDGRD
jgi:hypothetical protein